MQHTILYIPGLGDGYDRFRRAALRTWRVYGVDARLIPMQWDNNEAYEVKFQRVVDAIEQASKAQSRITLIGESAGASMAINIFAVHPAVTNLITIAGVNTPSAPVASYRLHRSPAFAESRQRIGQSLSGIASKRRRTIYSLRALSDNVVRAPHSQIAGAHNQRIWSIGHLSTIAVCLTMMSGYIIHLARHK